VTKSEAIWKQYDAAVQQLKNTDYFFFPDCQNDGYFAPVQKRVNDFVLSRYVLYCTFYP
jgi:hypothetical protein